MVTIYDLCYLFLEQDFQDVEIWDNDKGDIVWRGTAYDAIDSEYADEEISSIDNLGGIDSDGKIKLAIVLNIH